MLPSIKLSWLVPVAFVPQLLTFFLPVTQSYWSDGVVAAGLIISLILLLVVSLANFKQSGFRVIAVGLALNLLVIVLNGGFMPISPENASRLYPNVSPDAWEFKQRLADSKDTVIPETATRLRYLSDRFFMAFAPVSTYRIVFSLGDLFIAFGIFWWFWQIRKSAVE